RDLLSRIGVEFEVRHPDVEERVLGGPVTTARRLSLIKALSVWRKERDALVIGADTLVWFEGGVLGKPKDEEEAVFMLRTLSGRWHRVVTAVSFVAKGLRKTVHDTARVKFRNLTEEEIRFYVSTGEPLDKAGAYGVQGFGSVIVERIEGNFFTVMGLPLFKVYEVLKELSLLRPQR
ncbi:MAG: Maf family protein, partial [Aquificota bacterium]|nr:Maf family protein [Aquificota bacterium]